MAQKPTYKELSLKNQLAPTTWQMYLLICIVGLMTTGIVFYGLLKGERINKVYTPLIDAAVEIMLETTTAHLWFEEIISGDRHEDINEVWKHQDMAEWYAQIMLDGGKNPEGTFILLDDAKMRRKIKNVQGRLKEFRGITQKRLEAISTSGVGTDIDQRYDLVFRNFLKEAEEVKTLLKQLIAKDLSIFRYTQFLLIGISILLFIIIGISFWHFDNLRAKNLQFLYKANMNVYESEKQLAEANQLLETILKLTHIMAVFLDPQFNFTWVNHAYADTCRHEPSFFPGKNHFDLYPHEENQKIFQRVVDTGEPYFVEAKPFEFPDQPERGVTYWDWSLIPVKEDMVKVTGLVFTLTDVTERIQAEKIIMKQQQRNNLLLNSIPYPIMLINKDRIVLAANKIALDVGVKIGDYCWKEFGKCDYLSDIDKIRAKDNPDDPGIQCTFCRADEMFKANELENNPEVTAFNRLWDTYWIPLDNNEYLHFAIDVSEQKLAAEMLRKNEASLASIFQAAPIGIGVVIDRVMKKVNMRMCEMTGYSEEELTGQNARMLYPSDEEIEYVESEQYEQIRNHGKGTEETLFKHKDERFIDVLLSSTPLDLSDLSKGVTLTALDITERKKSEEERNRLLSAIEQAAETIVITDKEGTIEYVNPAFERIAGYTREEAIGRNPRILKSGDHDEAFYRKMWDTLTHRETWKGQIVNRKKDGTIYTEDASISPVFDRAGEVVNFVAVKRNITDEIMLKEKLRQAQKMEAIGTLAGGIAHDFNNILFPISGYAEMLLHDITVDSPFYHSLSEILAGTKRAGDLVTQILTFSRQREHELKPLKIEVVVKEALKLIQSSLPTTIKILQNVNKNCGLVMADPTQIHQIVMNLCTNAFHAMEETGGKLIITLKEIELKTEDLKDTAMIPGPHVSLTVADTGPGIEQSIIDRIFDPYFTTKKEGKGTGLGLAVVHGIVKSHGGQISVYSEPGKGTEFQICLPVIKKQKETAKVETITPIQKGDERILLVDDENFIVQLEKQMLERLGYHVTPRTSSTDALEAFRTDPDKFDLIITDLTMPNMTGDKLAGELIKIRSDIPVILCTGFSENMSKKKAKALGIKAFLMKPIVMSDLAKSIREVLEKNQ